VPKILSDWPRKLCLLLECLSFADREERKRVRVWASERARARARAIVWGREREREKNIYEFQVQF